MKEHWISPWVKCSLLSNKLKQEFVFTKPQPELSFNSSVPLLLTHHFLPTQRCGQQHTQHVRWSSLLTYLEDTLLVPFTHLLGPHTTPHQHHCMLPRPSYKLWRIPGLSATTQKYLCLMRNFIFFILSVSVSVCYTLSSNHGIFSVPNTSVLCNFNYSSYMMIYMMIQVLAFPVWHLTILHQMLMAAVIYACAVNTCSREATEQLPKCPIGVGRRW